MGGGLNHYLLLEFTLINQNNRNTLSLAHGVWTTDVKSTVNFLTLALGSPRSLNHSLHNNNDTMPI